MNASDEQIRAAIAEQAGNWLVANEEGLDEQTSAAFTAWLKRSPLHVEEFLGVSAIARDLKAAREDPEYSVEAILARARAEEDRPGRPLWSRAVEGLPRPTNRPRWLTGAVAAAACGALSLAVFFAWSPKPGNHAAAPSDTTVLRLATRHGEQQTRQLADSSVLHLDTDSAVTIRYSKTERLVVLSAGRADFEVAHEPDRAFRVIAGAAQVIDIGTQFDVRLDHDATLITVREGRVAVGPAPMPDRPGANAGQNGAPRSVQLQAGQQLRVTEGQWPATPTAIDVERATAWLRKEIVIDHEPLEHVAAEFNRYAQKPIEVATPALRSLEISGSFATDDTDAFVAFLRSLKGVEVDVSATQIRVSSK